MSPGKNPGLAITTAVIGILAGASLTVARSVYQLFDPDRGVQVNFGTFSWWANLDYRLESQSDDGTVIVHHQELATILPTPSEDSGFMYFESLSRKEDTQKGSVDTQSATDYLGISLVLGHRVSETPSSQQSAGLLYSGGILTDRLLLSQSSGRAPVPTAVIAMSIQSRGPAPLATSEPASAPLERRKNDYSGNSRRSSHSLMSIHDEDSQSTPEAVEAFDASRRPVFGVQVEAVADEGQTAGEQRAWFRMAKPASSTSHEEYWPSLYYAASGRIEEAIPLISSNTAYLLSKITGVSLQSSAGIVFGKISAGWEISFSGRAETPLFFDQDGRRFSADDLSEDRIFVFLNVAPGAHLLYLMSETRSRATIALPVQEGTATYVRAVAPHRVEISGTVLDGGAAVAQGLSKVGVRVVGQPGRVADTDERGRFWIRDVFAVGGHPLYLESDGSGGYTHRYRVLPETGRRHTLFRFREDQVGYWLDQLQGGVSAESGLAVAAVNLPSDKLQRQLYPGLVPLLNNPTLVPETYALSVDDDLTVERPLEKESPRFISVQIPEGANVAELRDENRERVWSELVISSPGVVNVIGPSRF